MATVTEAVTKRSSTRAYTEEVVAKEDLEKILEAGLKAPTGCNKQEIRFSVVKGDHPVLAELDEEKNRLKNATKGEHNFYYEAPVLIFLSAERGFKWSTMDAGIAVENMALTAEELGLGNLIIGCVFDALRGEKKEYFSKALQFPEGYDFEIALAVGHKAVEKEPHTYEAEKQITYV